MINEFPITTPNLLSISNIDNNKGKTTVLTRDETININPLLKLIVGIL
ncbi:hypothetical protein KKZ20_03270 [Clostridioides difficile]|nr:hypothetical protein [Clostridioides difficile]MBT2158228.1 hypothetical protein [Clostridioides difficile]CCL08368.1 hypothetical protein BN168_620007 [Clostridioides difficile CD002]